MNRLSLDRILEGALRSQNTAAEIHGSDSPLFLSLLFTQSTLAEISGFPHLVVTSSLQEAQHFAQCVSFFSSEWRCLVLPSYDVSPYSGLYPNPRITSQRLHWLYAAHSEPSKTIWVAPITSLLQKTLAPELLFDDLFTLKAGESLPDNLSNRLLNLGYRQTPLVEDLGTFSIRGAVVDIFSPAYELPVRLHLFGDHIETANFFDSDTQKSLSPCPQLDVIPAREILLTDDTRERVAQYYKSEAAGPESTPHERDEVAHRLAHGDHFPEADFLISGFYKQAALPLDHLSSRFWVWSLNPMELERRAEVFWSELRNDFAASAALAIRPKPEDLFLSSETFFQTLPPKTIALQRLQILSEAPEEDSTPYHGIKALSVKLPEKDVLLRVRAWLEQDYQIYVGCSSHSMAQRIQVLLEHSDIPCRESAAFSNEMFSGPRGVFIFSKPLPENLRFPDEKIVFLRDEDFVGPKVRRKESKKTELSETQVHALHFADLKPGDHIVHVLHGVGTFDGLKVMPIQGVETEFLQLSYRDQDKLYLPIYRISQIQKYSGPSDHAPIDKLGGTQWAKTTAKVRNQLREVAADLLKLYAARSELTRPPFPKDDDDFSKFEGAFPYEETDDQLKAISSISKDMSGPRPMDRLVCGDVGFGKTEVAMRAAFKAVSGQHQVAVLAPTTVLCFQHFETFKKRFKDWPIRIAAFNRFTPTAELRKNLADLADGKIDIAIGTHRLFSKDVAFKNLGLLIIDEEQRFGVIHKEKIRQLRQNVDTLAMSATPIPRTLNMSLVGLRDLSLINTAPLDRLPTRTFICKRDDETIRKAITSEISRGGQVFFIHNRIQSIYSLQDELRALVPDARIRVGHGQMDESELEKTMIAFYNHEIDVLLCTTIIESGIDNPRANTMFIDQAHTFGLSQLYQLRGRVGRSKERAFCYLLIPSQKKLDRDAQERLKIIQENTDLGSGIRIAHHDLEIRGAGNLLGEEQAGHIESVGYEMYLELLNEALHETKGEILVPKIEPDINVRIPALIPNDYMPDIRLRLSYYRMFSNIASPEDMDRLELDLRDRFGAPPEPVINLMGLMLIRYYCRELGIRDLSSGTKTISLAFTPHTSLSVDKVVRLATNPNKKFSLTPDSRLVIRMNTITWPNIYQELLSLYELI